MARTMTLSLFFCGTGHSTRQEGLIQSAYGKLDALDVDGGGPVMGRLDWKAIFHGPGKAPVTANRFNAALPGYKKVKRSVGGLVIGAGWDATTGGGLERIEDVVALGDAIGVERVVINLIGHSRGSITAMRIVNGLDALLLSASQSNPESRLLRNAPRKNILVNAYLNDPVGGPQGSGKRDACVTLPAPGAPHFFTLGCLRALQMLVPKRLDDTKLYNDAVPELTKSGFAPFAGDPSGPCLIGETDAASHAGDLAALRERTVLFLPGTHGSAVDTKARTPQSSIGTALLTSFLRRCGAGLSGQPSYTKVDVAELYAECQRALYSHHKTRSWHATRHPKRVVTTARETKLRDERGVYRKRAHLARANAFFSDPFLVNTHHHRLVAGERELDALLTRAAAYLGDGFDPAVRTAHHDDVQQRLEARGWVCHAAMVRDYASLAGTPATAQASRAKIEQYATVGQKYFGG